MSKKEAFLKSIRPKSFCFGYCQQLSTTRLSQNQNKNKTYNSQKAAEKIVENCVSRRPQNLDLKFHTDATRIHQNELVS
jgi:hypothetical protein